MARARDPNRDVAKQMYLESNGEMLLKDIAERLGKNEGTIRGWKTKDKWDVELNGALQSNERSAPIKKKNKPQVKKQKERVTESDELPVDENSDLTDKQRLFCIYYVKLFNATKAYQKAYGVSQDSAEASGPRLLGNVRVQTEIKRLKQHRMNDALFDKYDVLQKYKDIAFADMSEYIGWGYELEPVYDEDGYPLLDDDGNERMYKRSYVYLKNDVDVDATIVTGVTKGKDGISIKLGDKMRALEFLAKYTDLLDERENDKLRAEQQKMKNVQLERELGGTQHKDDPFENLTTEELKQIINEL